MDSQDKMSGENNEGCDTKAVSENERGTERERTRETENKREN